MRLLFVSLASPGHTLPMVPLAVAAREAGHDVAWAAGEHVHATLARHRLAPFRPADAFYDVYAEDLEPELRRRAPDLVIHGWGVPEAAVAARRAGTASLWHGFGRMFPDGIGLTRPIGTGLPHLDICPPSLQDKAFLSEQRIPLRPSGVDDPTPRPDLGDGPLVYLTLGTAFGTAELLDAAITALAPLAGRLVVAAGRVPLADLAPLPAGTTAHTWLPQQSVLQHAALVVHHGGSGTTLGALAAGVPQLLLPQGADQPANAAALAASGAAITLPASPLPTGSLPGSALPHDSAAIADAARTLLSTPSHTTAARDLAAEIAGLPSPAEVAAELPRYAR